MYLEEVEYTEFVSRVSLQYWEDRKAKGIMPPIEIEDRVYQVLEMLWNAKHKRVDAAQKAIQAMGKKKKIKKFPALV